MKRTDIMYPTDEEIKHSSLPKCLSIKEIMKKISYVNADDLSIANANPRKIKQILKDLDKIPEMVFKIALWPDDVYGIIGYPKSISGLSEPDLIDLYHRAYHRMLTMRTNTKVSGGEA